MTAGLRRAARRPLAVLAGLTLTACAAGPAATAAPTAAASPDEPAELAQPVVEQGRGSFDRADGVSRRAGSGPLRRYTVAVEAGLGVEAEDFAEAVDATLADPRSWGHGSRLSLQRVDDGPVSFRVVLASPGTADRLCAPLPTNGRLSCGEGSTAVINVYRWEKGADAYGDDLADYRDYVVNHEVGHTLGHGHQPCGGAGRMAPVMMQQTNGVGACRPNPWPFP